MKIYCDKCKVYIEDNVSHCPLCGRCCDESLIDKKENIYYPEYTSHVNSRRLVTKLLIFVILITFVCLISIQLLFNDNIRFSLQFLYVSIFVVFGVIIPVRENWAISSHASIFNTLLITYLIVSEYTTKTFGWGIQYVIPFYIIASQLVCIAIILSNAFHKWHYISPILITFIISIGVFIFNLVKKLTLWPSISALFVSLVFLLFLMLFMSKSSQNEIAKTLHF